MMQVIALTYEKRLSTIVNFVFKNLHIRVEK